MTRDRVENALRRVHSNALHNTTIEVFNPSVTYTQGEGFDVTYPGFPGSADATYDARLEEPTAGEEKQRSGTTSEVDVEIRVRDDTGQQWTGWGEEADAPAHVQDTADGTRYEIQTVVDRHDGLVELGAVEV